MNLYAYYYAADKVTDIHSWVLLRICISILQLQRIKRPIVIYAVSLGLKINTICFMIYES